MDYDKIGNFILERRKELNLTQKMLADKLNITDRAVSRWERGKGCPDISLLEPLSEILEVSILELLHGEKNIKNENKAIIEILKKSATKIKIWKVLSFILLNVFMVITIYLFSFNYLLPKIISSQENLYYFRSNAGNNGNLYEKGEIVIFEKKDIDNIEVGDVILFDYNNSKYAYEVLNRKKDEEGNILLGIEFRDNGLLIIKTDTGIESASKDNYFYIDSEHLFGIERRRATLLTSLVNSKNFDPYFKGDFYYNMFLICLGLGGIAIIILDVGQVCRIRKNS